MEIRALDPKITRKITLMKSHILYGVHAIAARLTRFPQSIECILSARPLHESKIQALYQQAQHAQIPWESSSRETLNNLCGHQHHQGLVLQLKNTARVHQHIDDVLADIPATKAPLILVLDGITDPHNLGACLRVADAMAVDAVLAPKDRSAPLNATVAKVACGAAEHIPYIQVTNLARTLRTLKNDGLWVAGTALVDDALSLEEGDWTMPLVWVMGAEGQGMRRLTQELCDYLVCIPMFGSVQSLNVSVATGMVLYETQRQRMNCN
jgi:23S rRNA (guanosine2251-2'-O)-methyltransferase